MVSRNCVDCEKPQYIREEDFPMQTCKTCGSRLIVQKSDGKNYFYVCKTCQRSWKIADLVDDWSKTFYYHGLAAGGDFPF
jgi:DNA-directed RNA polymerase subunit RPC12/RpoP